MDRGGVSGAETGVMGDRGVDGLGAADSGVAGLIAVVGFGAFAVTGFDGIAAADNGVAGLDAFDVAGFDGLAEADIGVAGFGVVSLGVEDVERFATALSADPLGVNRTALAGCVSHELWRRNVFAISCMLFDLIRFRLFVCFLLCAAVFVEWVLKWLLLGFI